MMVSEQKSASRFQRLVPAFSPVKDQLKLDRERPWEALPQWPAHWLYPPKNAVEPPMVGWFRLRFRVENSSNLRLSVTADERFDLWLDGSWVGDGPDRGDRTYWNYSTYEAHLEQGDHELCCRVWALGQLAPIAQCGVKPGFLLAGHAAAHELLSTGIADWRWQACLAWQFRRNGLAAPDEIIDGAQMRPTGTWEPPVVGESGNNGNVLYPDKGVRLLIPSELPAMRRMSTSTTPVPVHEDNRELDEIFPEIAHADALSINAWSRLLADRQSLVIAGHQRIRILIDLQQYCCARLVAKLSGGSGAQVRSRWSEAACWPASNNVSGRAADFRKGDRKRWHGGIFRGYTDCFAHNGSNQTFTTLWWRSGRWLLLEITTQSEPLMINELIVEETGHGPQEISLRTNSPADDALARICVRTLQCCAHETTMDCPHYEQLAYAGDARVQLLCWAQVLPGREALSRHTLRHFHASTLNPSGWSASSAPSRGAQLIPPFSLWWVLIASDYLERTKDIDFLRPILPALRAMVEKWLLARDPDTGLYRSAQGWNFVDAAFPGGVPPGGLPGETSGLLNWILLHAVEALCGIETAAQEPLLATRCHQIAESLMAALINATWDAKQALFLDAPNTTSVSEHTQALAVLYPHLPTSHRHSLGGWLLGCGDCRDTGVIRCQAFFCYYLFAAMKSIGADAQLAKRLEPWYRLLADGFTTTPEHFGNTRSDCHAWSAHPILWIASKPQ